MTAPQIIIFVASVLSVSVSIWAIWLGFFRPAESAEKAASRLWAEIARARKYEEAFLREKEAANAMLAEGEKTASVPAWSGRGMVPAPENDPKFKFISGSVRLSDE